MVIYNSPPEISHFDLGDSRRTHGELISWHADLDAVEGDTSTEVVPLNGATCLLMN